MNYTLQKIASKNNLTLKQVVPLQGGDINDVFLLQCDSEDYVVKLNNAKKYPKMFEAEAKGLEALSSSQSFRIPKVIAFGIEENTSYLLLEYLTKGTPTTSFWSYFAKNLAKLHKSTNATFGWNHNNYIGSLPQINKTESTASDFYINQRLEPQLKMARANGFQFSTLDRFFKNVSEEIPKEVPSLIHGDLWNGNYLVSEIKNPVLIDPAVAFAPREMDLAMMQLFGGFPQEVFDRYHIIFPLTNNWQNRITIWQLYYLLVHLNLFGNSYLPQVNTIIRQYS